MSMDRRTFLQLSAAGALAFPALAAAPRNGMPYRTLGKTSEAVSLLCLGGYHIGGRDLSEADAIALMRHAVDEGVNFFDNAWQYHDGVSEERMGKALKDGYRDKVFLMTKHKGLDTAGAQDHLETSLRRLDVDMIDLWQFHEIVHPEQPKRIYENGALDFALKAQAEGKIRYIGFTGHHLNTTHLEMIERGFDWDTIQMPLNVFDYHFRSFQRNVLPKAIEKNLGVIAMKTLGGSPGNLLETKQATAEECLRFAMSLPVSTVCSGMDSMETLKKNLATAKAFTPMAEDERAALLARVQPDAAPGRFEVYKTEWHRGSIPVPPGNDPNPEDFFEG